MSQINARHVFLARFIGTQEREDISYNKANKLNLWVTLTTCLCCILETGLYFAYNEWVKQYLKEEYLIFVQVHPWIGIIKGGIAETQETTDLKKKEKKEKKEKEKREKKEKKEKKKQEKREKKEKKKQEEMKEKENRKQDEQVEEAIMMEEIDEEE